MSLQWTIIATFLYVEIVLVLLLVLPVASPQRWQSIFKSRFLNSLRNQASIYFIVLLAVLVLFFLDAIREMKKYSHPEEGAHQHLDAEMQGNMRLFRAQRNFYISGFALFLSLVIRRLVTLISSQATLLAQSEAALKQAQSASTTARSLMAQSQTSAAQNDTNEAHDREITRLKEEVAKLEKALEREMKDRIAMKTQAESVAKEYDRLASEFVKKEAAASGEVKKDA